MFENICLGIERVSGIVSRIAPINQETDLTTTALLVHSPHAIHHYGSIWQRQTTKLDKHRLNITSQMLDHATWLLYRVC